VISLNQQNVEDEGDLEEVSVEQDVAEIFSKSAFRGRVEAGFAKLRDPSWDALRREICRATPVSPSHATHLH
jgi:hypothetical protein